MTTPAAKPPVPRCALNVRVEPTTRRLFKALAHLDGETIAERVERLMVEDIKRSKKRATTLFTS